VPAVGCLRYSHLIFHAYGLMLEAHIHVV